MKKIQAVIRPGRFEEIKEALCKFNINGITVTQVNGCGLQKGKTEVYRGTEYSIDLLPKLKMEMVVSDNIVDDIIRVIVDAGRTGEIGDGKIFVYPLETAVRIRTGEAGEAAI